MMKGRLFGLSKGSKTRDSQASIDNTGKESPDSLGLVESTKTPALQDRPPLGAGRRPDSHTENDDKTSKPIPDFWKEAHQRIRADEAHRELLEDYSSLLRRMARVSDNRHDGDEYGEDDIDGDDNAVQPTNDIFSDEHAMRKITQSSLKEMQTKEWLVRWKGREVFRVREKVKGIVNIIKTFSGLIGQIASLDTHVGVAWAGICVVLPLMTNDTDERDKAISGIEKVARIIARYTEVENQYRTKRHDPSHEFEETIIELYRTISMFYMKSACYFTRSTTTRFFRNILKVDEWETTLSEIDKTDKNCSQFANVLSIRDVLADTNDIQIILNKSNTHDLMRKINDWLLAGAKPDGGKKELKQSYMNSGRWLVDSETYSLWETQSKGQFWIQGPAGTGKSSLISIIIKRLQTQGQQVASFYCTESSSRERQQSDVPAILRALIAQLALSPIDEGMVAEEVQLSYQKAESMGFLKTPEPLSIESAQTLLVELIDSREQVTLIVDALDECRHHKDLLKVLRDVYDQVQNLRLLVSSQYVVSVDNVAFFPSIKKAVAGGPDSMSDMKYFIQHEVDDFGKTHHGMIGDDLADEMVSLLAKKSGGMFKWTRLCLDFVLSDESETAGEIRANWDTLKNDQFSGVMADVIKLHDKLFEKGLPSLQHRASRRSMETAAWRVLQWVSGATRPLNDAEYFALQTAPEATGSRSQHDTNISKICRTLLNTSADGTVVISHSTVQDYVSLKSTRRVEEYLQEASLGNVSQQSRILSESRKAFNRTATSFVASECMELLDSSSHDQKDEDEPLKDDLVSNPLLKYAAKEWTNQIRACVDDEGKIPRHLTSRLEAFFHPTNGRASYRRWLAIYDPDIHHGGSHIDANPLYYAVLLDLPEVVQFLLDEGLADLNSGGGGMGNPFQLACYRGQWLIINLILNHGIDINVGDDIMGTPLQAAIAGGHTNMAKMLLVNHRADPKVQSGLFGNALQIALALKDTDTAEALAAHGAAYVEGMPSAKAWAAMSAKSKNSIRSQIETIGKEIHPQLAQKIEGEFTTQLRVLALCVALTTPNTNNHDSWPAPIVSTSQRRTHSDDLNQDGFLPERIFQLFAAYGLTTTMRKLYVPRPERLPPRSPFPSWLVEVLEKLELHREFLELFPHPRPPSCLEAMFGEMFTHIFRMLKMMNDELKASTIRRAAIPFFRRSVQDAPANLDAFRKIHEKMIDAEKDTKLALQIEKALTGPRDDILAVLRDMAAEMADLRKEVRDLALAVGRSQGV